MRGRELVTPGTAGRDHAVDRTGPSSVGGRPDGLVRHELLHLIECYTGEPGSWDVDVLDGAASIRRTRGVPGTTPEHERRTVRALAHAVRGVVSVEVLDQARSSSRTVGPVSA